MTDDNSIQIYQSPDGETCVDVRFELETVWLTQRQMGEVFDTTPENVLMHLRNIYKTGELDRDSTAKDFLVVRTEGKRQVKRQLKHYNLDAVISVGYRVNSKRGVQFRTWATHRLREYLVQGYTINQQRFEENAVELKQALALIQKAAKSPALATDMGRGLVDIMGRYTTTFLWLQQYDEGLLKGPVGFPGPTALRLFLALSTRPYSGSLPIRRKKNDWHLSGRNKGQCHRYGQGGRNLSTL